MIKYSPSNGSEGSCFEARYCGRCAKDAYYRENQSESCDILVRVYAYRIDDPEYPIEWVQDNDFTNPRCTEFVTDTPEPLPFPVHKRCEKTMDLFEQEEVSK